VTEDGQQHKLIVKQVMTIAEVAAAAAAAAGATARMKMDQCGGAFTNCIHTLVQHTHCTSIQQQAAPHMISDTVCLQGGSRHDCDRNLKCAAFTSPCCSGCCIQCAVSLPSQEHAGQRVLTASV